MWEDFHAPTDVFAAFTSKHKLRSNPTAQWNHLFPSSLRYHQGLIVKEVLPQYYSTATSQQHQWEGRRTQSQVNLARLSTTHNHLASSWEVYKLTRKDFCVLRNTSLLETYTLFTLLQPGTIYGKHAVLIQLLMTWLSHLSIWFLLSNCWNNITLCTGIHYLAQSSDNFLLKCQVANREISKYYVYQSAHVWHVSTWHIKSVANALNRQVQLWDG